MSETLARLGLQVWIVLFIVFFIIVLVVLSVFLFVFLLVLFIAPIRLLIIFRWQTTTFVFKQKPEQESYAESGGNCCSRWCSWYSCSRGSETAREEEG